MAEPIVFSLGSINADFEMRVAHPPAPGEMALAADFARFGGGKAANVAFLARRLGVAARLYGRVGDDALRDQALAPLRRAGVDLAGVTTVADAATAVAMIMVPPDGNKSIILASNANDAWAAEDAEPVAAALAAAPPGSALVADYEVPSPIVERAVAAARERGLIIVIDPSPAARVDLDRLAGAAVLTPNPAEAEGLIGIRVDDVAAAAAAADRLCRRGVPALCVKFGAGGCLVADASRKWVIRPVPVPVVDKTGAGDAFAGALAVALMEGRPLIEAAAFAAAASHLAVTAYGSQPAYPTRDRILDLLPALIANTAALEG
ncbi:MAG TPA: PfkB family carbohydrate kinase [Stellaceae bacterium]|nr:PfkB family carbohydrate kinase [Stellaceae bacterium]